MWQMENVLQNSVQKILQDTTIPAHKYEHLLSLSTRLGIVEIRDRAIYMLSHNISALKRIQLGAKYKVDGWLLAGYRELILVPGGISSEVEVHLGQETTSKLLRIREEYLKFASFDVTDKIKKIFAQELLDAVWSGSV